VSRLEARPVVSGPCTLGAAGCDGWGVLDVRGPPWPSETFGTATGASRRSFTPCADAKPNPATNAATHAASKTYAIAISTVLGENARVHAPTPRRALARRRPGTRGVPPLFPFL